MDISADLPPDLEWYKDQIAGHHPSVVRNGMRQIGILKERGKKHLILKLAQDGIRGEREVAFYRRVEAGAADPRNCEKREAGSSKELLVLGELHKFLPRFYGCCSIQLNKKDVVREFLQLEDITHTFEKPCIMDIKIGRVTYGPDASEEKKRSEDAKCQFQNILGFRILGYRAHTESDFRYRDRIWGRELTVEKLQQAFEEYLVQIRPSYAFKVLDNFLERLSTIRCWFERQEILHFYASSLLFVYEGHSKLPPRADIRMIDFSHVFSTEGEPQRDANYLHGLLTLIELFEKIRADLELKISGEVGRTDGLSSNGMVKTTEIGGAFGIRRKPENDV